MTRAHKLAGTAAALLLMVSLSTAPAKAQFAGGGEDMMTQMAPMLNMMKAKMGKKRFGMLMQTMGPMFTNMMGNGGFGGGFGGFSGFGGGSLNYGTTTGSEAYGTVTPSYTGGGFGNYGGFSGFGGADMSSMMTMIGPMMNLATSMGGTGTHHRKHARPKS